MSIQVISFNCILKNRAGKVLSSTFSREVLTTMEEPSAHLTGLVKELKDVKKGEKRTIQVSAEEAYGFYDPQKIILFPRKKMDNKIRIGESITIVGKSGTHRTYKVINFQNDMVSLDGNHPLAGQDLIFEIEIIAARSATEKEIDESCNLFSEQRLH